jgi:2-polyprenyl-3-methyl-5-hydroxy-6-metoxy-1,4-benzoquinol methylase
MSLLFPRRASKLIERMDDPQCDHGQLFNTYDQFDQVNGWVANWRYLYTNFLKPYLKNGSTVLDIGFGGGDVIRNLSAWALQDGLDIHITGVDRDPRAFDYARQVPFPINVTVKHMAIEGILKTGQRFDVVISNHLLHHLPSQDIYSFCKACEQLCRGLVLHNDIRRSGVAYLGFSLTALGFRKSFITEDGLISIRRSFTETELKSLVPEAWKIQTIFPYRLLAMFRHDLSPSKRR